MGFKAMIEAAVALAILAASTGQLPKVIHAVRAAQLKLLKESQSSAWGRAFLLPASK